MNKKAFTLIELLVVILILGILAAIALPQYRQAVEKSRSVEAVTIIKRLKDFQSYDDVTGQPKITSLRRLKSAYSQADYTQDAVGGLPVFIPEGQVRMNNFDYILTSNMHELFFGTLIAVRNAGPYKGYGIMVKKGQNYCVENTSILSKDACEGIFGAEPYGENGIWKIYTYN